MAGKLVMIMEVPSAGLRFPVPPLADDVVLLRPWCEADVPGKLLAFRDPVMQRFSWRTTPYTEADARSDLAAQEAARLRGAELNFALAEPGGQAAVLGACSLHDVRLDQGCAALGYWLAPQARGRGVATHTVRLLARWAFAELGLARLELTCGPDNEASQHVAERCGDGDLPLVCGQLLLPIEQLEHEGHLPWPPAWWRRGRPALCC